MFYLIGRHACPTAERCSLGTWLLAIGLTLNTAAYAKSQPNILWITAEDMSCNLGCYGDDFATTPVLDQLARQSVRFSRAFATAPVCSPARSCLITGVYATSLGTQTPARQPVAQQLGLGIQAAPELAEVGLAEAAVGDLLTHKVKITRFTDPAFDRDLPGVVACPRRSTARDDVDR